MSFPEEAGLMTPPRISEAACSLESLKLVSFNAAGCVPSKEAPRSWNTTVATEAIVEEVLRKDPDILALQEWPSGDPARIVPTFPGYQVLGSTRAHADFVVLLVKKGISACAVPLNGDVRIPGVLAELIWQDRRLLVGAVHLAPFGGSSAKRFMQVQALLEYARAKKYPILFAGDTNMRETEDAAMENSLGLMDTWKVNGSLSENKFTWDTMDHTGTGGSFNRYYGPETRQYNARYDRVYYSNHQTISMGVDSFELIAHHPLTNPYHFLSDHFGISTVLSVRWGEPNCETAKTTNMPEDTTTTECTCTIS